MDITAQDLKALVPLTYQEGRGEQTLLEKIQPYVDSAKNFLRSNIAAPEQITPELEPAARTIISAHALCDAVPVLDVTLTATGFAVGTSDTLAPASPHRVKALRESLIHTRDKEIETILRALIGVPGWKDSNQGQDNLSTLLDFREISQAAGGSLSYDTYLRHRSHIRVIEDRVALRYISVPLMAILRAYARTLQIPDLHSGRDPRSEYDFILHPIKYYILQIFRQETALIDEMALITSEKYILGAVDHIRNNPDIFPQWHESATAALFGRTGFRNQKKSGGFFF